MRDYKKNPVSDPPIPAHGHLKVGASVGSAFMEADEPFGNATLRTKLIILESIRVNKVHVVQVGTPL